MAGGLTAVDWTILLLYALGTVSLGYYYGRRQKTTREYFTGSGRMNPILIGFSMFATLLSTISYLAVPGEAISKGPGGLLNFLAYPFAFLIVAYVIIPVYMRSRVTSAYELLEDRLGLSVRLLGSVLFLLVRLIWMSLLIYLSAKAMTVMMGVDESWIPLVTLLTGLVAVLYTSLGGLRAVVITDTVQTLLMLGGACLAIGLVTWNLGGLSWVPTGWQPHWDVQPLFSFDPGVRISILGSIFYVFVLTVCTAGGDQTMVQRFMATRDARAARRAYLTHQIVNVVIIVSLWMVGFALLGFFQEFPGNLPAGIELTRNGDNVFPYYIAYLVPPGVSGLVVSAMFAAAMSSIDSGVNSITAVVSRDFLARFGRLPESERGQTRIAKILAFVIGGIIVVGSSFLEQVPGNIWAVSNKTSSIFVAPIFGLFVFAFFVPFAKPAGVWVGTVLGVAAAALTAFSGPIFGMDPVTGEDPVSFMWVAPVALTVDLSAGTLISYWQHRRRRETVAL